jgi:GR25 family glycosyltransferase involved in LPS biosynthesis
MNLFRFFKSLIFYCVFPLSSLENNLSTHLKKCEKNQSTHSIENIDFVYLINLDKRTDRMEKSFSILEPYHIRPYRFSAINGWQLKPEAFNDVGLQVTEDKIFDIPPFSVNLDPFGSTPALYSEKLIGKTVFSDKYMSAGAIGCYLSHLSILQDALDSGYDTIWVLEDDFLIEEDPTCLSKLINELDVLTKDTGGWDILYTDSLNSYTREDLIRPDFADPIMIPPCKQLGSKFIKLGHKFHTYSMIIRRSGMEKILNFAKIYGMFLPYDWEIFIVPNIQIFQTTQNITSVHHDISDSDTLHQK